MSPPDEREDEELTESDSDLLYRLDTAIQTGTDEESIRAIDALLVEGANLHSRYLSPLCSASTRATTAVLEYLFTLGATIEADTFLVESPLHFVASEGCIDMARALLRHATVADLHRIDHRRSGWTALGQAVYAGHEPIARLLLEAGTPADLCLHSHAFDTPLRYAVDAGRTDLVELLLKYGANPDQNGLGGTPRGAALKLKDTNPEIFAMIDRIPRTKSPV